MKKEIFKEEMLNEECLNGVCGGTVSYSYDLNFLDDLGLTRDQGAINVSEGIQQAYDAWAKIGISYTAHLENGTFDYVWVGATYTYNGQEISQYEAYVIASQVTGKRIKSEFLHNIGLD